MMEIDKIKRVALGSASEEEKEEVSSWAGGSEERLRFLKDAGSFYREEKGEEVFPAARRKRLWSKVNRIVHLKKRRTMPRAWKTIAACAAVVAGVFFLVEFFESTSAVLPRGGVAQSGAVQLILSDGSVHEITSGTSVSGIPGFQIDKKGCIQQLQTHGDSVASAVVYNEIIVPRGGEYLLTLADGSNVILNSETRIKFPVTFAGTERRVSLDGEAYFDVMHDDRKPFLVDIEKGCIRVLGTRFNVKAYQGVNSSTTLVSGKVEVVTGVNTLILAPGQQCEIDLVTSGLSVREADMLSVLAWKNGEFVFKDVPLAVIMNELARWYDSEVVYDSEELKDLKLHIYMDRAKTLEEVLQRIAMIGNITYQVDGKKVTIKKR